MKKPNLLRDWVVPSELRCLCVAILLLGAAGSTAQALSVTPIYSFTNGHPFAGLTVGPDRKLYGTTYWGGDFGYGSVFQVTTNGSLTTLVNFDGTNGAKPMAEMTLGPDGVLYGTTYAGGSGNNGTVFRLATNGALITLVNFDYTNGAYPTGSLTLGSDGIFYGTTSGGGGNRTGTAFRVTTNGVLTTFFQFNPYDGSPNAGLTLGPDGNFYGTAISARGGGNVFGLSTNGWQAWLSDSSFVGPTGLYPSSLALGPDGRLYGTTYEGGPGYNYRYGINGRGTVFSIKAMSPSRLNLVNFNGTNGANPMAGLTLGPDGDFYGTTIGGGNSNGGTAFKVTTNGALTTLVNFDDSTGRYPFAKLTLGPDGFFYGSTELGGSGGRGTIFRLAIRPPVADARGTLPLVISANGSNAAVVLDGSRSVDPDGDPMQFTWYKAGQASPLATGALAVVVLPVGTNLLQLVVNDFLGAGTNAITVQVISTAEAIARLAADVTSVAGRGKPLLASLDAASASIERSDSTAAVDQLRAFEQKLRAQLAPLDSALADTLTERAQAIIAILNGGDTNPAGRPHDLVVGWKPHPNGRAALRFGGQSGQMYLIEASPDIVNWELIGVAADLGNGSFGFEDVASPRFAARFYKVLTPSELMKSK